MKKLYLGAFILCTTIGVSAQEVMWQKDIPSSTQDFLSQIIPTIDQQYLITGSAIQTSTLGLTTQNNGYDFHLIKLNQQGEQVWEKYFSGNKHDFLSATISTQDGGFLLSGTSYSDKKNDKKNGSIGGSDIWLIRINEFGDELWQKTIGSSSNEEARGIVQATDLGFFVAGNVQNFSKGYGSKDVLVSRIDKDGNQLSQLILGGRGTDEVERMIPTKDGGVLLGVYSTSGVFTTSNQIFIDKSTTDKSLFYASKQTENFGEGDYWVIKLDKNGKVEWERNFGGKGDDRIRTLTLNLNGYIIGGESRSQRSGNKTVGIEDGTDVWMIALNEKGEEQWQKSYNFKNRDILTSMNVLHSADDKYSNGILLGGYTQAEGRIGEGEETFWMLHLDRDGNEKWRKYVKGESKKREERLSDLKVNRDGSILLAGTSATELGKENWKVVKLKDSQVDKLIEKLDVKIYPNPVSDYAYIEIGFDFAEAEILLYDMGGRLLQNVKTNNKITKINTQMLVQGAYLITVKTNTNKAGNAKLIKK